MVLSTLWKYFLIGFFVTVNVALNGGDGGLKMSNIIRMQAVVMVVLIMYVMGYLLSGSKS